MAFSSQRIDNYARSMFSREHLNLSWVSSCAEYLRQVFGEKLSGAVFLDYAFGRGNWSVAALHAGARRVISIDASSYNVEKLNAYCLEHSINGIEIIHGNIMQEEFHCDADLLWIYGILHHIPDDSTFLKKISNLRRDNSATALLYAYDKGSLREAIVETARLGHIYETAKSFAADTLLFSPAARLRARDDLTAPHVAWYSQNDLARLAESVGLYAVRKANDFSRRRLSVEPMSEFRPHHLICEFQPQSSQLPDEPTRPEQTDISIIREFGRIFGEYASQHDLRAYPSDFSTRILWQTGRSSIKSFRTISSFRMQLRGLASNRTSQRHQSRFGVQHLHPTRGAHAIWTRPCWSGRLSQDT